MVDGLDTVAVDGVGATKAEDARTTTEVTVDSDSDGELCPPLIDPSSDSDANPRVAMVHYSRERVLPGAAGAALILS